MATFDPDTGVITSDRTLTPKRYFNAMLDTGHANNELLPSVPDFATGGAALTQATSTKQLEYRTDALGTGKPGYYSDGVDDSNYGAAATAHLWGSVCWVFRPATTVTTSTGNGCPFVAGNPPGGQATGMQLGSSTGGLTNEIVVYQFPGSGQRSAWTETGASIAHTVSHVITVKWNVTADRYDIHYNGSVNKYNASNGTAHDIVNSGATSLGGKTTEFYSNMQTGVGVIYEEVLTDAERAAFESYVQDIWGVTVENYDAGWQAGGGNPAATFTGEGTLTSTAKPAVKASASGSGEGTLSATAKPAVGVSADFTGSGSLTATGSTTEAHTGSATMGGSGTLSATAKPAVQTTAGFTGSGSLTTTNSTVTSFSGTATMGGAGTLSATPTPKFAVTTLFSGEGTLSAVGALQAKATATLTGGGTLTTVGSVPSGGGPAPSFVLINNRLRLIF